MKRHGIDVVSGTFGALFIWVGLVELIPEIEVPVGTVWPILAVSNRSRHPRLSHPPRPEEKRRAELRPAARCPLARCPLPAARKNVAISVRTFGVEFSHSPQRVFFLVWC